MKRLIVLALLFLISACANQPLIARRPVPMLRPVVPKLKTAPTNPNAINSLSLEVGIFTCIPKNGEAVNNSQYVDYVNSGPPIYVPAGWIWIGAASPGGKDALWLGGILDIPFLLQDITSGTIFAWSNQDRYAAAPGISDDLLTWSWAPYYAVVNTGDDIRFTMVCAGPYSVDNEPVSVQGLAVLQYLQPSTP